MQYSALHLSFQHIITFVCVIIFFLYGVRETAQCCDIAFDLGIFKHDSHKSRNANHRPRGLPWCLEVWVQFWWGGIQKNNHGLGNENWNRSQAGSSLKCFRMHPESKRACDFTTCPEFISLLSLSTLTLRILPSCPCFHEIGSVELQPQQ